MRVLMFGWEFPPFKSGGLGTACQGMATALAKKGTEIFFVLPRAESDRPVHLQDGLTMFSASGTRVCTRSARLRREEDVREIWHDRQYTELIPGFRDEIEEIWREKLHLEYIDSPLRPYLNSGSYLKEHRELQRLLSEKRLADPTLRTVLQHEGPEREHLLREIAESREQCETLTLHGGYGEDLMSEVYRYACAAAVIAGRLEFDVIHVHDWMTYPAGMLVKQLTGKPLVAHIHALEHDRSGDNLNQTVADIEKAGMEAADRVIAWKGATFYAIAIAVRRIVQAILRDERSILTVSSLLQGEYGLEGVCLSLPCVVGRAGVLRRIPIGLAAEELSALRASAKAVRAMDAQAAPEGAFCP